MNLFEVYPHLHNEAHPIVAGRALRLIAISGVVYDEQYFYFELGAEQFWARSARGTYIGIGGAKVRPDLLRLSANNEPVQLLARAIRESWGCKVDLSSPGASFVLQEAEVGLLQTAVAHAPFLFVLTPPRLGGGDDVPDALAQAVYLLHLRRRIRDPKDTSLLSVRRAQFGTFLEQDTWQVGELLAQPWAELRAKRLPPGTAFLRPVLALRGLQELWRQGIFPLDTASPPAGDDVAGGGL